MAHAGELPLPIQRIWRRGESTHLQFAGAHPGLRFSLHANHSLWTALHWRGKPPALLHDIDTAPARRADGRWHCLLCNEAHRKVFDTLDALWEDELFLPWMRHVQALLQPRVWIIRGGTNGADWCDAWHQVDALPHLKRGGYVQAFRTCVEPRLLNPRVLAVATSGGRKIAG